MNGMLSILSQIIMTSLTPKESLLYKTLKQSTGAYLKHRPYLRIIRKKMALFGSTYKGHP